MNFVFFFKDPMYLKNLMYLFPGCAGFCPGSSPLVVSRATLVAVCRLLTGLASLVAQHGLQGPLAPAVADPGLHSCSSWALESTGSTAGVYGLGWS